ncbi:hypothetical protein [Mangrovibacterium sp.]|uniref:hypothetical protein n=1 Tax=Mangrovibacterium sp. TaxID=1961364 RepID=UPI003565522D
MNSAVITKIEVRLIGEESFTELPQIMYSAKLTETVERNRGGLLYQLSCPFNVAKVSAANESQIESLVNRKAQFRLTDGNGVVHLVGSDEYPARLLHQKGLNGTPGSFNGYACKITCTSTNASLVS